MSVTYNNIKPEPIRCRYCGDDEGGLIRDRYYGWICTSCLEDLEESDNLDLDEYEAARRERIAEENEY